MTTTILACFLIAAFLAIEGWLRRGRPAKSLGAGETDRASTRDLDMAYGLGFVSLLVSPVLNHFAAGRIAFPLAGWMGLAVALSGLALLAWAKQVLSEFHTHTLRVAENQTVLQRGPYHFVRHPGYLGSILMWTGAGLATTNWIIGAVVLVTMFLVYHYRIQAEEAVLIDRLGEAYIQYKTRTWRLIPLLY